MQMDVLRCDGYDIVMQEIPEEITLAINVTGCPYHCVGCHSPHLWDYYGDPVNVVLPPALQRYSNMITCVCFMGGDHNMVDLRKQCEYIKANYPHLKTALYTGIAVIDGIGDDAQLFDYIKVGPYVQELGGIDNPMTNQRLYYRSNGTWNDITHKFWRQHNESSVCK